MVLSVCRSLLRDKADAEDAFQAVFLILIRRAGSIQVNESFGGWLHRVAYASPSVPGCRTLRGDHGNGREPRSTPSTSEQTSRDASVKALHDEIVCLSPAAPAGPCPLPAGRQDVGEAARRRVAARRPSGGGWPGPTNGSVPGLIAATSA